MQGLTFKTLVWDINNELYKDNWNIYYKKNRYDWWNISHIMYSVGNICITDRVYSMGKCLNLWRILLMDKFSVGKYKLLTNFTHWFNSVWNLNITNGFFWRIMFLSKIKIIHKIKEMRGSISDFPFGDFRNPLHPPSCHRRTISTTVMLPWHELHHHHATLARGS